MPPISEGLAAALSDRYLLTRELGAGGMATVYLAEDRKHQRPVAVKVLRPELAATLGPDRFVREVGIAARLSHPHIVGLLDSGEAAGFLYYVMPYVEGTSLRQKLQREGELPIPEALRILRDVADALAYAHGQGVVHRDVKPENIMLVARHALVMDFGVAKAVGEARDAASSSLTSAGTALGTPAYMAPEQAAGDAHVDHRADLYAWGIVAYELLAGQPPFVRSTPQKTLGAQVTAVPESVTHHRANVPGPLAHLVMQCLEKKAADRPQSAEEVLRQLDQVLTPSGGITPTDTRPYQTAAARRARRRRVLAGMVGVPVLVAAGAGVWSLTHRPPALDPALVAIVPFENKTGSSDYDALGEDLAERLQEQVSGRGVAELVSAATVRELAASATGQSARRAAVLSSKTRAGLVVVGTIRKRGDSLEYRAEVLRMPAAAQIGLVSPVVGAAGRTEPVETLGEELAILLAAHRDWGDEIVWGKDYVLPRSLDAYRAFVEAVESGVHGQRDKRAAACGRARAVSPEWPMTWQCLAVSNVALDSVLAALERRTDLLPGDRDDVAAARARLAAAWELVYQIVQRRFKVAPATYAGDAVGSARITGRHEEAVGYARFLEAPSFWSAPSRDDGAFRAQLAWANHEQGRYEEELRLGRDWRQRYPDDLILGITFEITAQAGLGNVGEVEKLVAESETLEPPQGARIELSRAVIAGMELAAHGHPEAAQKMYERAAGWHAKRVAAGDSSEDRLRGWVEALLKAGRLEEASDALTLLEARAPSPQSKKLTVWWRGLCEARRGNRAGALAAIERLGSMGSAFQYFEGNSVPYLQAAIYAALGDVDRALLLLREAYAKGDPEIRVRVTWHRDPEWDPLRELPGFQQIVSGGAQR